MPYEIRRCETCGQEFNCRVTATIIRRGLGRFCSHRCHCASYAKPRLERTCRTCGKGFTVRNSPSVLARDGGHYCSQSCASTGVKIGRRSRNWQGGRQVIDSGHVLIHRPGHPMARPDGYILEHRLVMADHLGRMLDRAEKVHHINGNPADNRITNLQLLSQSEHMSIHRQKAEMERLEWAWTLNG